MTVDSLLSEIIAAALLGSAETHKNKLNGIAASYSRINERQFFYVVILVTRVFGNHVRHKTTQEQKLILLPIVSVRYFLRLSM